MQENAQTKTYTHKLEQEFPHKSLIGLSPAKEYHVIKEE